MSISRARAMSVGACAALMFGVSCGLAPGVENDWIDGGATVPRLWSDGANWQGGAPVNGVGDVVRFTQALGDNAENAALDADIVLTLGEWHVGAGVTMQNHILTTSAGAMTWDNGAANAHFETVGNGLRLHDARDMILAGDLDYAVSKQRGGDADAAPSAVGARMVGVVSGEGKLNLDILTGNHDADGHARFWIEGAGRNTYTGGTDIKVYGTTGYGRWMFSDVDMVIANKNGAFGPGDVTMSDPFGNLRITDSGGADDRLPDAAALRLMSGNISGGLAGGSYAHTHLILDGGVNETVQELYLNGFRAPPGAWGAVGSGATYESDMWFKGGGILTVSSGSDAPAVRETAAAGDWHAGSTWGGTVPSYFDDAQIGHAVAVSADAAAGTLALGVGGSLTVNAGRRLDVQDLVDVAGGSLTVNGALEADRLTADGGLTVGAGATVIVGSELIAAGSVNLSPAATVRLPGVFAGDAITIGKGAALTLASDVVNPRALTVNGALSTSGNVSVNHGGRLSGEGTIAVGAGKELGLYASHWQLIQQWGGTTLAPGSNAVGVLTVHGDFEFQDSDRAGYANVYEWEIGMPSGEVSADQLRVVGGLLNLEFSFSGQPSQFVVKISDGGGSVRDQADKLDLFTYDAASTVNVNTSGGQVQNVTIDTTALEELNLETPGLWKIGAVGLYHEAYSGGGGHIYLTGISGGAEPPLESLLLIVR